jgi:hypothetical protein
MNPGDLYLGITGQEVKLYDGSRTVTPTPQEITKATRAASGIMLEDITCKYIDYQISYEQMTGPEHEKIEALYNLSQHLNFYIIQRDGSTKKEGLYKMTWTPGDRKLVCGDWLWEGVSINLEWVKQNGG